jgi:hypothetical protein
MSMFDHATAVADRRHRAFFDRAGEVRQVWAQRTDGTSFYLADGGVDDQVRADAHAGELSCPYPGCPDRRFIAKGGSERRHHFAHHVAGQDHRRSPAWRHQALLMLADWSHRRYPHLEVELDDREDNESLRLRSPRTDRLVRLTVTYDRRYQLPAPVPGAQLLVGHSRALLLPRKEAEGPPGLWWCGEGRLVGDLVARRGWALAINPQERLIATVTTEDLGRAATSVQDGAGGLLLCVVAELDDARLDGDGLHTAVSDAVDRELERRRAAEAAESERRRAAEAAGVERRRALEADLERQRRDAQARVHALQATERQLPVSPTPPSPSDLRPLTRPAVRNALVESDSRWPTDLQALRRLLDDEDLARRLEQPLSTDVMCDVESAIWHLMAVLEWRKRGSDAHPMAVRAAIVMNGCGYSLTGDAIAAVLAAARTHQ